MGMKIPKMPKVRIWSITNGKIETSPIPALQTRFWAPILISIFPTGEKRPKTGQKGRKKWVFTLKKPELITNIENGHEKSKNAKSPHFIPIKWKNWDITDSSTPDPFLGSDPDFYCVFSGFWLKWGPGVVKYAPKATPGQKIDTPTNRRDFFIDLFYVKKNCKKNLWNRFLGISDPFLVLCGWSNYWKSWKKAILPIGSGGSPQHQKGV